MLRSFPQKRPNRISKQMLIAIFFALKISQLVFSYPPLYIREKNNSSLKCSFAGIPRNWFLKLCDIFQDCNSNFENFDNKAVKGSWYNFIYHYDRFLCYMLPSYFYITILFWTFGHIFSLEIVYLHLSLLFSLFTISSYIYKI